MGNTRFFGQRFMALMIMGMLSVFAQPALSVDPVSSAPEAGIHYSVIYKHSNKCQDVRGADGTSGADVIQWPCHGNDNQKLMLIDKGNGYYSLVYKHSNLCTDVFGANTDQGQKVIQWPCHGQANQLFTLEDRGGGYYSFRYKHSGQCVDVFGGGTADAANVIQWPCHGGDNQLFRLEAEQTAAPNTAEGVYMGITTSGFMFNTVVLENEEYWGFYGDQSLPGGVEVNGFMQGSGASDNGNFTSSNTRIFNGSGNTFTGNLSASYVSDSSFNGVGIFSNGSNLMFTGSVPTNKTYDYDTPASITDISGFWSGNILDGDIASLQIATSGAFVGSADGCIFSGTVSPRAAGKNIFDLTWTFGGAPCAQPKMTGQGIGVSYLLSSGSRELVLMVVNGSRSLGTGFYGDR